MQVRRTHRKVGHGRCLRHLPLTCGHRDLLATRLMTNRLVSDELMAPL
jgi:hypothetical protein